MTLVNKLFSGRGTEQSHPQWVKQPICSRECSKIEAFGYGLLSVGIAEASHSTAGLFNTLKSIVTFNGDGQNLYPLKQFRSNAYSRVNECF